MHSDSWGGPADEPGDGVLDAFSYAPAPRRYDDEHDDWSDGTDSPEAGPSTSHSGEEEHRPDTDGWDRPSDPPTPDIDEPTAPLVFAVNVSNPAGTISATATISGWLLRIELTPDVRSMTEYELARDIVATAHLASVKGQASQHILIQDMLTYQGLDRHAARDYIDEYMNLTTPDQAAEAEAQARARYLRGEY